MESSGLDVGDDICAFAFVVCTALMAKWIAIQCEVI